MVIEIEIDGQTLPAEPGQMIIQVADRAGIYIPRFCYHKHLSIAANCRMCLVEVEKAPKVLPACATPVAAGMKVYTRSRKTIAAQRDVMEFLLINHPLDCPICDQGGECELQDLSMGYGASHSAYTEPKRAVYNDDLGPLIATEMTRCILCTRCTRFGEEVAGMRELGVVDRGGHAAITTYVKHLVQSSVSGNIIDLCPVGALTSKPFQFKARAWELCQAPSIAPHDCLGSNINVHTLNGRVLRVVSHEHPGLNATWLSDRDRFSYEGLMHPDRLQAPQIRVNDIWQTVTWEEALSVASEQLKQVIAESSADQCGALISPSATLEELYLFQKIIRGLGSLNIDHRLRECDMRDQASMPVFPQFQLSPSELATQQAILIIGSHLSEESPLLAIRVRQAARQPQSAVCVINAVDDALHCPVAAKMIVAPHHWVQTLETLKVALRDKHHHPIANLLQHKASLGIVAGALVHHHPEAARIRLLIQDIASLIGARVNYLTDGSNSAGGWLAGAIPHRLAGGQPLQTAGLNAYEMLHQPRQAYVLFNVEPIQDCAHAYQARYAMQQAKCLIAFALYRDPFLLQSASVMLPIVPFTETAGTFINAMGDWQSFHGVAKPFASARPGWKALAAWGQFLQLEHLCYESSEAIREELRHMHRVTPTTQTTTLQAHTDVLTPRLSRIGEIPSYSIDSLVRRAPALQKRQALLRGSEVARMHPDTATQLGITEGAIVRLRQGEASLSVSAHLDTDIAKEAVWLPGVLDNAACLGDLMGALTVDT